MPAEQIIALEVEVRAAGLNNALPDARNPSTLRQYEKLPGKRKKDAQMAAMFAARMIDEGDLKSAEHVVRKAIKKHWTSELAGLYGKTRIDNQRSQIALATSWLADHKQDANVSLTLARLNLVHEQLDKARVYYNMAIELGAGEEAYLELGQYYENEGNHKTALAYYKRGIEASLEDVKGLAVERDTAELEVKSLESIVTPGSTDITMVADNASLEKKLLSKVDDAPEIIEAQIIEHKA